MANTGSSVARGGEFLVIWSNHPLAPMANRISLCGFSQCRIDTAVGFVTRVVGQLAWSLGIRDLTVKCDSTLAVKMVYDEITPQESMRALITSIRQLLVLQWNCHCYNGHVYREANHSADHLAQLATQFSLGFHVLNQPPSLVPWLLHDANE
ncbi:uncharacterized protein LOC110009703 [Jatropha curcas]|uniref:uncharacterized protein LOC110009703 n=1 Tax=Jatropha curcas TaxID=180498 RepID=UPI0009D74F2B|nr:uncharacterized protein LOC110009703 [Jatropha curcas]